MELTTTCDLGLFAFNRSFDSHIKVIEELRQTAKNLGRMVVRSSLVLLYFGGFAKVMRQLIKHQLGGVHFGVDGRHAQAGVESKATQRGTLEQSYFVFRRQEPAGIVIDLGGDVEWQGRR